MRESSHIVFAGWAYLEPYEFDFCREMSVVK